MILIVLLYPLVIKERKKEIRHKRNLELQKQFGELLQMTAAALKSGYSIENAFVEARKDFVKLYGEESLMGVEAKNLNQQTALNIPLEQILDDLAERSGLEEIQSFAQVLHFAKRSGGDFIKIFQTTVEKIRQKGEVSREIETVMAAKKLEQRIMNLVPMGILLYVSICSPEFIQELYGNALGIGVMSGCLILYGVAYQLSRHIVSIQV